MFLVNNLREFFFAPGFTKTIGIKCYDDKGFVHQNNLLYCLRAYLAYEVLLEINLNQRQLIL